MSQRLLSGKRRTGGREAGSREGDRGRQMENPNPVGSVMLHAMFFMMSYSNTFERYVFVILLNWQLSPRNWEWFYMYVCS